MEGRHAALAFRLTGGQTGLGDCDALGIKVLEKAGGVTPRLVGSLPGDDVQADTEAWGPAGGGGSVSHALELRGHLVEGLAPGQVHVGVPGRDANRGR